MPRFVVGDRVRQRDDWNVVGIVLRVVSESYEPKGYYPEYEISFDCPDGPPSVEIESEFDLARVR